MKRFLSVLLALAFALSVFSVGFAEEVVPEAGAAPKMTKLNKRITAYTEYLADAFDNGDVITYVGVADVNRDTLPELFYVVSEEGDSTMHFCYYDADAESVEEYSLDEDEMGKNPKNISLVRRVRNGEHRWSLKFQSKNDEKYNQIMFYTFQRADDNLTMELKFQRLWKGSKKQFFVDGMQTNTSVYFDEVGLFNERWPQANNDTKVVSVGVIRKVSNKKKWGRVRLALRLAADSWEIKRANL